MTLGSWGEQAAAKYLIKKGYIILERNFRCRLGEIDIIALDGKNAGICRSENEAKPKLRASVRGGECAEDPAPEKDVLLLYDDPSCGAP